MNRLLSRRSPLIAVFFFMLTQAFAGTSLETQTWLTSNGSRVVFYPAPEVPMLDINIAFAAGSAYDGRQWGLSALTTALLDQGNAGMNASTVASQFAQVGAQYGGASSQDMIALTLRTLTRPDALKQATAMFASLINHPDFPPDAFLREKNQQLMSIKQDLDLPETIAKQTFYQALYGQHPYAHPINGTPATVHALTVEDVRHFYQQYVVSRNAVIVLVGAIDVARAHEIAELMTHDLPKGKRAASIPLAQPLANALTIEVPHASPQTVVRLGTLGITHQVNHYFPLQVGNYILGGGTLVSQLATELREKRGLTYNVTSQFSPMPGIGPFVIGFSTQNKQTKMALNVTRDTLSSFIHSGPTEEELAGAKQYLTGSFSVSLGSNRSMADLLLRLAFYRLPSDFLSTYIAHINAVQRTEIQSAFQTQINPNALLQVTVGPV